MSIVLGVIVRDLNGNREMFFASDGRALEHGTKNIRNEDYPKIKKLGPKTCIGYAGHSRELYEDVFNELDTKMKGMKNKDLVFVSSKLRQIIIDMLKSQKHAEIEKHFGPLNHQFIIGGFYNRKLRLNILLSSKGYQISKHDLSHSTNVAIEILGSSDEVQKKMKEICQDTLGHAQSFDEIIKNIRYAISKVAEQTHDVNNHIFVRRLSRQLELEKYVGYE
jgi:hypothetical protein